MHRSRRTSRDDDRPRTTRSVPRTPVVNANLGEDNSVYTNELNFDNMFQFQTLQLQPQSGFRTFINVTSMLVTDVGDEMWFTYLKT